LENEVENEVRKKDFKSPPIITRERLPLHVVLLAVFSYVDFKIPEPVWAVGFALEQTLRDATLAVFSYVDFKVASAYNRDVIH
jgi:hypothetical protein